MCDVDPERVDPAPGVAGGDPRRVEGLRGDRAIRMPGAAGHAGANPGRIRPVDARLLSRDPGRRDIEAERLNAARDGECPGRISRGFDLNSMRSPCESRCLCCALRCRRPRPIALLYAGSGSSMISRRHPALQASTGPRNEVSPARQLPAGDPRWWVVADIRTIRGKGRCELGRPGFCESCDSVARPAEPPGCSPQRADAMRVPHRVACRTAGTSESHVRRAATARSCGRHSENLRSSIARSLTGGDSRAASSPPSARISAAARSRPVPGGSRTAKLSDAARAPKCPASPRPGPRSRVRRRTSAGERRPRSRRGRSPRHRTARGTRRGPPRSAPRPAATIGPRPGPRRARDGSRGRVRGRGPSPRPATASGPRPPPAGRGPGVVARRGASPAGPGRPGARRATRRRGGRGM